MQSCFCKSQIKKDLPTYWREWPELHVSRAPPETNSARKSLQGAGWGSQAGQSGLPVLGSKKGNKREMDITEIGWKTFKM